LTLFVKKIARIGAAIVTRIGILASGPAVLVINFFRIILSYFLANHRPNRHKVM
jgi:hypothetical protein